jgi:hypothetical protein
MSPVFDVMTSGVTGDPVDLYLTHVVKSKFSPRLGTCSRNVLDCCVSNTISTGGVVAELLPNV